MTITWAGPLCALLSSFTWAVGTTGYSRLSRTHSAFSVNFTRALIALPCFVVAVFVVTGGWAGGQAAFAQVRAAHWGWFTLSTFASYGMGDVLFLWSTRYLGIPAALAISSSYPLWTAAGGYLFRGEPLNLRQGIGLVLTVAGVAAVILSGAATELDPQAELQGGGDPALRPGGKGFRLERYRSPLAKGVGLAVLTSVLWAINSFAISQGGSDLRAEVANTLRMVLALAGSAAMGQVFRAPGPVVVPWRDIRRWFWVFFIEAFGGSYFFTYGLSHSPLAIGATLSSLAPAISVPVAWAAGLEKFSVFRTLGIAAVVAGIWLLIGSG